jgi:hypothetical protein
MGYRLFIKKDSMHLVSISRYDALYRVCESEVKMDENWHELTKNDLITAKDNAFHYIDEILARIDCYKRAVEGEVDFDKRVEVIGYIGELDEELEKYQNVLPQLDLLIQIVEESDTPVVWGVF